MPAHLEDAVSKLFDSFNRRAVDEVLELCAADLEFEAASAEFAGRSGAYAGHDGMQEYFADVDRVWDELLITPRGIIVRGEEALAIGRVFARSRSAGLRDMPVAWRFRASAGLFDRIKVYEDPSQALSAWRERR